LSFSTTRLREVQDGLRRRLRPLRRFGTFGEAAAWQRYSNQKFDSVTYRDILEFLSAAQQVTGRFEDVKVAQIREDIFCIYR
jgi:hypothetical protein